MGLARSESIDWDKAKAEFWEKFEKAFPNAKKSTDKIDGVFQRIWKEVRPFPGIEETIEISIDKNYRLKTSLSGWVLLGAIAVVAANIALDNLDKTPHLQELSKKVEDLERELKELKARMAKVEEYKEIA